jgi:FixJ family two-component response regulator
MVEEMHGTQIGVPHRSRTGPAHSSGADGLKTSSSASVHIVDDDRFVCESLGDLLRSVGYNVVLHRCAADFLKAKPTDTPACLVLDVRLPGTSGLEFQKYLRELNIDLPVILMTAFGDIPMSVKGMKAGAIDFLTKPIRDQDLLDAVAVAVRVDEERRQEIAETGDLRERYALLTRRERQVMTLVTSGLMNKEIAYKLSISEVTVKMHRRGAMRKLAVKSVAGLARIATILGIEI